MRLVSMERFVQLMDKVEVRWVDVLTCRHMEMQGAAWVHYDENETWDLPVHITVGYVLHMDDEKLVISGTQSLSAERHVDTPMIFPLGCITHIWTLEVKEVIHDQNY